MMDQLRTSLVLLSCLSIVSAQYPYGSSGGGGGGAGAGGAGGGYNPYYDGGDYRSGAYSRLNALLSDQQRIVITHGVLASAAFVFFFPLGAILIRLGNFKGLWLVHAAVQAFAYLLYIAAFGIGIYMTSHVGLSNQAHPIIGIILFILLFFQPFLGLLHHFMFRKHSRRVVWSYGHIWLGRIAITLGIINGGLGLQLAQRTRVFAPSAGDIIAYSVVAAVIWLIYVSCAILGEIRRSRVPKNSRPPMSKEVSTPPVGSHGTGQYSKSQNSGHVYA